MPTDAPPPNANSPRYILDASALLAALRDEPGAERVYAVARSARISAVNLSEVVAKLQDRGVADDAIDAVLSSLEFDVVAFDAAQARMAGKLRVATRSLGLSLGDRACLSLARIEQATAMTADRTWAQLDLGIAIEVIRPGPPISPAP